MRAAVLQAYGAPRSARSTSQWRPTARSSSRSAAAGIDHVDVLIFTGRFYAAPPRCRACRAAIRRHVPDGRRVYVDATVAPCRFTDRTRAHARETRHRGPGQFEDAVAATLGDAGLAAWLSLGWRARLGAGRTVLYPRRRRDLRPHHGTGREALGAGM